MQGENERQWKTVNKKTYDIFSKKRARRFWKIYVVVV